jgi:5S rRNA maturation endonuclease (ribonuclease M5)
MGSIDYEAIRARNPLPEYCERRGIHLRRSGGSLKGKCPLHHERNGESFTVFPDGRWRCFGKCDKDGDVTHLEQALGGGTLAEAAERLGAQRIQQTQQRPKVPKQEPAPSTTKENPFGLPYRMNDDERRLCVEAATRLLTTENAIESIAHQRGWKPATIRNLALEPSLGVTDDGKLAFLYESGLKVRWKENGERRIRWAFGKPWLWRGGYIQQAQTVYICEGETDAITLVDSGLEEDRDTAVIALPSASFHIDRWASLFVGKNVVIATDADEAGVKAAEQLARTLGPVTASLERLELARSSHA